ncbi:hypothetical protein ACFV3R_15425 [Streptomyces sp. NPDC059740]|uniref:hypothetical protein n=1 Tax=Streptomyces sp. NPDC059740 TaxID=3346926 RepID=UPI00365973CE
MPPVPASRPAQRFALFAGALCVLAVVAAVISFVQGSWLGVAWILVAGVTSNMAWYYVRRLRQEKAAQETPAAGEAWTAGG